MLPSGQAGVWVVFLVQQVVAKLTKKITNDTGDDHRYCDTILAQVIFPSFEIINEKCFISSFMMTYAILNLITKCKNLLLPF